MKRPLPLAAATVLCLVLAGCGGSDDQADVVEGDFDGLVSAAQEEGSLDWYSDLPEALIESVATGFEEEYGIEVNYIRSVSSQLGSRFAGEAQAGNPQADVLNIASQGFWEEAVGQGWFSELTDDTVDSLDEWPEEFLYDDTYALINVQPLGIAYNTDTSPVQPQTWEEVADPQLDGRLMMGDTAVVAYSAQYLFLKDTYGDDLLSDYAALDPIVVDSLVPGTQQMVAGEADVAIPSLSSVVQPLIDEGAPLELVIPEDTAGVNQYAGVVEEAAHPNAARLFMSYLLSMEGQERVTAGIAASVLEGVPGAMELPSGYTEIPESDVNDNQDAIDELLDF
ncbi:extracellular solute-binding protein [Nocardioides zeae]|uniref:Extracellular solute-binding protein n=1 Tax=Nocardioides imazamoxiresistens TaxID=3231893 RepID=A0ABU3PR53_9ACTN|nr:extracellular solute-binding protein [Nocardioides zeae]MDT9591710.1 extracellular solute-binding protein [Nocardioides zeae]